MKLQASLVSIDLERADGDSFPVTVSTDAPLGDGYVLEHTRDAIDLSRVPLPVVEGHDRSQTNIGVVERLQVAGGKLKGVLRLGKSSRAQELAQDIRDRIVTGLSVGAEILEAIEDAAEGLLRVTRWRPLEVSIVSVPMDPAAGIYRMETNDPAAVEPKPKAELSRAEKAAMKQAEANTAEFLAIAREYKMPMETVERAIRESWDEARFRKAAVDGYFKAKQDELERSAATSGSDNPAFFPGSAARRAAEPKYSITRAIQVALGKHTGNCLERELHDELARDRGGAQGLLVPLSRLGIERTITVGGDAAGAATVGTQHMFGDFIELLRAESVALTAGVMMLPGARQNMNLPRQTAGATAEWLDLDGTAEITASDSVYDSVSLSPKHLCAMTNISYRVATQSLPMADDLVTRDLVLQTATALDTAILRGSGVGQEPEGIYAASDVDEEDGATAGQPTNAELLNMWTAVAAANALRGNLAWIGDPAVVAHCLQTDKGNDTGSWLADAGRDGFSIHGYPLFPSNNIGANGLIFGNWSEVIVAEWDSGELLVDPYSGSTRGDVAIRFIHSVDVALRHGASFSRLKKTA